MFFGLSRKLRALNLNRRRKRSNKTGKNKGSKNVNNKNNIRFKIEEIDTPPSPSNISTVKTVKTESLTPVILSESKLTNTQVQEPTTRIKTKASSRTRKMRRVKTRTPTPYPRRIIRKTRSGTDTNTDSESHNGSHNDSEYDYDNPKSVTSVKQLNTSGDIILFFMGMLTTVKLYHWKTMSYATHKATDELYDDLNKYVDEFVEVLIGHKDGVRATLPKKSMKLYDCASLDEFKRKIETYKQVLMDFTFRFGGKKNTDLLNIRDEILAVLNKTLYLLSFK